MRLNGDVPTVLLPIETLTRELDSKLVMASALAAKGVRGIVGHKEALKAIASSSSAVVWQGKSLFSAVSGRNHIADNLVANRSAIMFLHDEGGMHQVKAWPNHVLKTHRIEYLRKIDVNRVCVWGERQKQVLSSYAQELKDAMAVTGTPRFDLCLTDYDWVTREKAEQLRGVHGPFILVCSRFAMAAHSQGQGDPFERKLNPALWPKSLDQQSISNLWFSKWQRDVHDFADFVVLTKELSHSFPQYTIVLRPHPSESLTFYKQAFTYFRNVTVTRDGGVLPWIRAADLVVHSNCTTGIEAVLAGRPVVNLLPESEGRAELDVEVAREAGYVAGSIAEAMGKAEAYLRGQTPDHKWSQHAKTILSNLTEKAVPKVTAETLSVLKERGITSSKLSLPKETPVRDSVRRLVKRSATTSYAASKRGPMAPNEIEAIVQGYRRQHAAGGRITHMTKTYVVIDPA